MSDCQCSMDAYDCAKRVSLNGPRCTQNIDHHGPCFHSCDQAAEMAALRARQVSQ